MNLRETIAQLEGPGTPTGSTAFVLERRGPKRPLDPRRAYGAFVEEEPDGRGGRVPVATVLLTNRECPWRCIYCDLWKDTLDATVPAGTIREQISRALGGLEPAKWLKLYNAGSFFDPRAIPPGDVPGIAEDLVPFERIIVESHPALVGEGVLRLRDLLRGRLEVAIGLEVADDAILARLNKGMTLADFARAAEFLRRAEVDLRAFVLVQPPFVRAGEAVALAVRSIDFAERHGARVVSLIPTRGGNGALEALAAEGDFAQPRLATLEEAFDAGLRSARALVLADLWGLERFADCARCFPARRDRLARVNLAQRTEPRISCSACGTA